MFAVGGRGKSGSGGRGGDMPAGVGPSSKVTPAGVLGGNDTGEAGPAGCLDTGLSSDVPAISAGGRASSSNRGLLVDEEADDAPPMPLGRIAFLDVAAGAAMLPDAPAGRALLVTGEHHGLLVALSPPQPPWYARRQ
eukprot:CAMPEP_0180665192 /NCGR_PEP_ID=MMETSP1037_2-20121125/61135_1 /TAXON_ID=632150 /ORGANISM="Azadinium spinosum, Strain 3D9" /LENGTH=136 /DNA_ID=CAMNT_0022693587 /DNA_START=176 /DNA_END=584 /DNA_ORIENTATION=+